MARLTKHHGKSTLTTDRRLRIEELEPRKLLAITVDTSVDELDGDLFDGDVSLRDAIAQAPAGETILFDGSLSGSTISLDNVLGELRIERDLTIDATSLAGGLTISAGHGPDNIPESGDGFSVIRVDDIDNSLEISVTLRGLALTGGDNGIGSGGIASLENLTVVDSLLFENSSDYGGGAIFSTLGKLTLLNSTVRNNQGLTGGGIEIGEMGTAEITNTTLSGNSASGAGGGIFNNGITTITNSTFSGNLSSNGAAIRHSDTAFDTFVHNSIIAGSISGIVLGDYNLQSDTTDATISGIGNLLNVSAGLAPLANNGGPTETHALMPGSMAIDAGDMAAAAGTGDVPLFDQRGNNYGRVQNGRIDIGAFEVRDTLSADFDGSGFITGTDFLAWQRGFGSSAPNATKIDGDADNDLDVDSSDLVLWESQFGAAAPAAPQTTQQEAAASPLTAEQVDAALALVLPGGIDAVPTIPVEEQPATTAASFDVLPAPIHYVSAPEDSDLAGLPESSSGEARAAEEPWLTDELLEQVFG